MLLQGLLVTAVTLGIVRNLFLTSKDIHIFPKSIPWTGRREEWLSRFRACMREFSSGLESMKAGYDKVRTLIILQFPPFAAYEILLKVQYERPMLRPPRCWLATPYDGPPGAHKVVL